MSKTYTISGPSSYDNKKLLTYFIVNIEEEIDTNVITFKYTVNGGTKQQLGQITLSDTITPMVLTFGSSAYTITIPSTSADSSSVTSLDDLSKLTSKINSTAVSTPYAFLTALLNKAAGVTGQIIEPTAESDSSQSFYIEYNGYTYKMESYSTSDSIYKSTVEYSSSTKPVFTDNPTYTFKNMTSDKQSVTYTLVFNLPVVNKTGSNNTTSTVNFGSFTITDNVVEQKTINFGTNCSITIPSNATSTATTLDELGNLNATVKYSSSKSVTTTVAKAFLIAMFNKAIGSTDTLVDPTFYSSSVGWRYTSDMVATCQYLSSSLKLSSLVNSVTNQQAFSSNPTYTFISVVLSDLIRYFFFNFSSYTIYNSKAGYNSTALKILLNKTQKTLTTSRVNPSTGGMVEVELKHANTKAVTYDEFIALESLADLDGLFLETHKFLQAYYEYALSFSLGLSSIPSLQRDQTNGIVYIYDDTDNPTVKALINNGYVAGGDNLNPLENFATISYTDETDWLSGASVSVDVNFVDIVNSAFMCIAQVIDSGIPRSSTINITTGETADWGNKEVKFIFYQVTQPSSGAITVTEVASNMDSKGNYWKLSSGTQLNKFTTKTWIDGGNNNLNSCFNGTFPLIKPTATMTTCLYEDDYSTCAVGSSANGIYYGKSIELGYITVGTNKKYYAVVKMYNNKNYDPTTNTITS